MKFITRGFQQKILFLIFLFVSKKDRGENEEFALNDKGQRRFHGAFTGGFHAGYNNTVGSEAGFTPAQYDRNKKYTVFDIMDEEDLGDHTQGQTIQTKEGYDTLGKNYTNTIKNQLAHGVLASMVPDELVVVPKTSIGYKLLKKLGWDERSKKNMNFQMDDDQSDDSIDFDKLGDLDVSDFINQDILNNTKEKEDETIKKKRDIKILQKLRKKPLKSKTKKKNLDNFYKGILKYKTDKYGLGYIPTSKDYLLEKEKQELNENGEGSNRIDMGKLNYDGMVYQEDNKEDMEIMDEMGHEVQDRIKDKQMQNLFQSREEKNDFYSSGFFKCEKVEETKVSIPSDYDPEWRIHQ